MATVDFRDLVDGTVPMKMVVIECANCGTPFAMTKRLNTERQQDHQRFYCPCGHSNYYPDQTDEERLRDELAAVRQKLATARQSAERRQEAYEAERRSHAATKGRLTKTLKRVQAGVCPHCNRTFTNLQRHCQTKHPEVGTGA